MRSNSHEEELKLHLFPGHNNGKKGSLTPIENLKHLF